MNTPDFTPPAIASVLIAIATAGVILFKLDLSDAQQAALTALIGAVTTLGYLIADAIVRHGRAGIAAAKATQPPPAVAVVEAVKAPTRPRRRTKPAA